MSYLKPTASSSAQQHRGSGGGVTSSSARPPPPASPSSRRRIPPPSALYTSAASSSPSPRSSRLRRQQQQSPSATPRISSTADGSNFDKVDDGPVVEFVDVIDALPSDSWKARTLALERLLGYVPKSPTEDNATVDSTNGGSGKGTTKEYVVPEGLVPFYLSPTTLRRLASSIGSLLTDPRSTVVKHACHHLTLLVERTGSAPSLSEAAAANKSQNNPQQSQRQRPDRARHLLRDLLPTILSMHAQTVNVIRGYATSMMLTIIPLCRFKSALPTVLDALRKNKSRDVREASARYLRAVLDCWSQTVSVNSVGVAGPYLTKDVATHIGNALARALMDPSQCVRMEARLGFETFRTKYPDIWDNVVHRDGGPLSKDYRLKKSIINAAVRADAERALKDDGHQGIVTAASSTSFDEDDRSVNSAGSNFSYQSSASGISKASGISYSSRMGMRTARGGTSSVRGGTIPRAVSTRPPGPGGPSGASKSMIPAPSPRTRRVGGVAGRSGSGVSASMPSPSRKGGMPLPRTPPKRGVGSTTAVGGSNKPATANAFASVIASPAPNGGGGAASRDHMLALEQNPKVHNRAATSIQAAFRGVVTRKSILPPQAFFTYEGPPNNNKSNGAAVGPPTLPGVESADSSEKNLPSSPEMNMIQAAHKAVDANGGGGGNGRKSLMGNTARIMASRRRTIGAKDSGMISPPRAPASPPDDIRRSCASPSDGRMHETPTATSDGLERLEWKNDSPAQHGIAFDANDMAKARRSKVNRKSCVMLQQRLRKSSIGGASAKLPNGTSKAAITPLSPCVEHVDIARELLSAHRSHIDGLMATLRMEMDIISDFEAIIQDDGKDGPSEDDVLDYFESMQMCLDERSDMGNTLRKTLDRISQGEEDGS